MHFNLDNYKLESPFNEESEVEKCHCAYCDVEFDLDTLIKVRNGKWMEYRCLECDEMLIAETVK